MLFGLAAVWVAWALNLKPKNGVLVLEKASEVRAKDAVKIAPGRPEVDVKQGHDVLLGKAVTVESGRQSKLSVPTQEGSRNSAPLSAPLVPPALARQPSDKPVSPPTRVELVPIEENEFLMGSPDDDDLPDEEKPQRKVWIRRFLLGKTEVTQDQYQAVMRTNPSHFSSTGRGRGYVKGRSTEKYPVENVSWFDAILFCNALSEQHGLTPYYQIEKRVVNGVEAWDVRISVATGLGYRLPTEAEWECACRAKTETTYPFGGDSSKLAFFAWFNQNSEDTTHPVGALRPNELGVFDMYGNVAEWCWDGYSAYQPDSVANPQGPTEARERVVRGGSYQVDSESCRPAIRGRRTRSGREKLLGFRVAKY